MKELEFIVLKGLPASGKSNWAKEYIEKNSNWKRVNKDELRAMIDCSKWSKQNEKLIELIQENIIKTYMIEGYNIIVDNTHLSPKWLNYFKNLVDSYGGPNRYKLTEKFFDIPVQECLLRNRGRINPVPDKVILDMYNKHLKHTKFILYQDVTLPKAIICDLDGTLCCLNGRNPFDASTCDHDLCNDPVASVVDLFSRGDKIILVSGREDKYKEQTINWLKSHGIFYNFLFMRKSGDSRKDSIVKREIFDNEIKNKYYIRFVLDDRPQVIRMWRELGLFVFDCGDGVEF